MDFRLDNSEIRKDYMQTGANLKALADSIAAIGIESIGGISVISYSSPEGRFNYNKALSGRRAGAMYSYMTSNFPLLADRVDVLADGESWHLFRRRTVSDTTLNDSDRTRLLEIIDSDASPDAKKTAIKNYSPALWRKIVREWFPEMRRSFIRLDWTEDLYTAIPAIPSCPARLPDATLTVPERELRRADRTVPERYRTVIALKSNLLYDAATALNFAVEIPMSERYSILYEHHCPWWNIGNRYALQLLSFGGEFRWWFLPQPREATGKLKQRDALTGHFLGLYGMGGKFDVQAGRELGCNQCYFLSGGLSYGYAFPIGKYLNLEFSVSAGYAKVDYQHYIPAEDWSLLIRDKNNKGTMHYFGPTKAEISLVLPIRAKIAGGRK